MTPTVVALPGTLCTPRLFRPLAHRMANRAPMAAYAWMDGTGPWDIPAVADRLLARVRRRAAGPVVLAGHSTGGAIALQAAIRAAGDGTVAGLLIINSGANTAGHGDIGSLIEAFRTEPARARRTVIGPRSFAQPPPTANPVQALRAAVVRRPGPLTRLRMAAYARRVPAEAVIDVLTSQRDLDLAPRLPAITCPVTVLHGTLDTARTPVHARAIADGVRDGEVRWVRTGHTPPAEDPHATADALISLLARLPAATR